MLAEGTTYTGSATSGVYLGGTWASSPAAITWKDATTSVDGNFLNFGLAPLIAAAYTSGTANVPNVFMLGQSGAWSISATNCDATSIGYVCQYKPA